MNRRFFSFRPLLHIPMAIGGVVLFAGVAFLFGLFVMLLWNWLMPSIFGLGEITYWQGWGLVLLAHILFKSGHSQERHRPREREWKSKFRDRFEKRFKEGGEGHDRDRFDSRSKEGGETPEADESRPEEERES